MNAESEDASSGDDDRSPQSPLVDQRQQGAAAARVGGGADGQQQQQQQQQQQPAQSRFDDSAGDEEAPADEESAEESPARASAGAAPEAGAGVDEAMQRAPAPGADRSVLIAWFTLIRGFAPPSMAPCHAQAGTLAAGARGAQALRGWRRGGRQACQEGEVRYM